MKRRIGILTSGGDCPGLNAAIRGVAKAAYELFDVEIVGIRNGYGGLIEEDYQEMTREQFSGILTLGGTILGTSRQPFRKMQEVDENGLDKVSIMKKTYKKLKLDCLVTLGGNGTHRTANLLSQEGLNVIGLPRLSITIFPEPILPSVSIPLWRLRPRRLTASIRPRPAMGGAWLWKSWATKPDG